ncbi:MAG: porin family protein [Dysgonamonadaceae bacterium]|jgi:hypothetical protein|nr:porin family protein [Dysgonamonadaceae bacterium]
MKNLRKILFVALFVALAVNASAQLNFGIKAGVNASGFSGGDFNLNYKAGYSIGLMAHLSVPIVGIGVESGLYYSTLGAKNDDYSMNPSYLQLPILLTYRVGVGSLLSLYPSAGVYFGYGVGGSTKYQSLKMDIFGKDSDKLDTGISVGLNLQVTKIVLGIGYDYGLKSFSISDPQIVAISPKNLHNSSAKLTVAYIF